MLHNCARFHSIPIHSVRINSLKCALLKKFNYILFCAPCQEFSGSSPKRRRAEEKDEGIGSPDTLEEEKVEELRREMLELRQQLDKERAARMQMEEQVSREEESLWECGFTCFVQVTSVTVDTTWRQVSARLQLLVLTHSAIEQSVGDKPTSWIYLNSRLTQRGSKQCVWTNKPKTGCENSK